MEHFIHALPKAELHVHLLGTIEPEQILTFAKKNNITSTYTTIQDIYRAYRSFNNLEEFLVIYDHAAGVMKTEDDFYELLYNYLMRVSHQGTVHVEIFFEIQTYIPFGISFETIINGLHRAQTEAQLNLNITCKLILCFLRDHTQDEAMAILEESMSYKDKIVGIGLAAKELGNPPSKFIELYKQAKIYGYKLCVHAGEEDNTEYIWQAIKLLDVDRIDHGVACMQDPKLVDYLVATQIPLTVCPLSNIQLNFYKKIEEHPLKKMLKAGLRVSINSDDPAFFGSLSKNFTIAHEKGGLTKQELITCAKNSFLSSFISENQKKKYVELLAIYAQQFNLL